MPLHFHIISGNNKDENDLEDISILEGEDDDDDDDEDDNEDDSEEDGVNGENIDGEASKEDDDNDDSTENEETKPGLSDDQIARLTAEVTK